jgi:hypothetical protein
LKKADMLTKENILYTADAISLPEGIYYKNLKFYMYAPSVTWDEDREAAVFELISDTATEAIPSYTINYNIDIKNYGKGRGYDSTVWQKTYMDGIEKYIMIAELNTVVPTFDVSADAPT